MKIPDRLCFYVKDLNLRKGGVIFLNGNRKVSDTFFRTGRKDFGRSGQNR